MTALLNLFGLVVQDMAASLAFYRHLGLDLPAELDTPAEVEATYDQLVSLGHHGHKGPWNAVWGQRYAIVDDPDGNAVDLSTAERRMAATPPASAR